MKPKAEIFFDAITLLPEDVVEEAQEYRFRKKPTVWKKVGSLAACLMLVVSLSLLMLPRGCGSSGGNADISTDMNGAPMPPSTDSCAPADSEVSGDSAPEPGDAPVGSIYDGADQAQFTAKVIEIYEDSILVEDEEGRTIVSTAGLELPELAVGDRVCVTFSGDVITSDPAVILGTQSIEKLENND
ncbi:MAG: hypothetical protein K2O45_12500 [Oscillospiraceae bacterium]|nr:hypothetical protein [Oscillospiraceae bacterium]